eukprot:SAG22_NODE_1205_length_5171_cov_8.055205_4_plen_585_part_01
MPPPGRSLAQEINVGSAGSQSSACAPRPTFPRLATHWLACACLRVAAVCRYPLQATNASNASNATNATNATAPPPPPPPPEVISVLPHSSSFGVAAAVFPGVPHWTSSWVSQYSALYAGSRDPQIALIERRIIERRQPPPDLGTIAELVVADTGISPAAVAVSNVRQDLQWRARFAGTAEQFANGTAAAEARLGAWLVNRTAAFGAELRFTLSINDTYPPLAATAIADGTVDTVEVGLRLANLDCTVGPVAVGGGQGGQGGTVSDAIADWSDRVLADLLLADELLPELNASFNGTLIDSAWRPPDSRGPGDIRRLPHVLTRYAEFTTRADTAIANTRRCDATVAVADRLGRADVDADGALSAAELGTALIESGTNCSVVLANLSWSAQQQAAAAAAAAAAGGGGGGGGGGGLLSSLVGQACLADPGCLNSTSRACAGLLAELDTPTAFPNGTSLPRDGRASLAELAAALPALFGAEVSARCVRKDWSDLFGRPATNYLCADAAICGVRPDPADPSGRRIVDYRCNYGGCTPNKLKHGNQTEIEPPASFRCWDSCEPLFAPAAVAGPSPSPGPAPAAAAAAVPAAA